MCAMTWTHHQRDGASKDKARAWEAPVPVVIHGGIAGDPEASQRCMQGAGRGFGGFSAPRVSCS